MILIADAGSTKTAWTLVDRSGHSVKTCRTSGINPTVMSPVAINRIISGELKPFLEGADLESIHYYGAGIIADKHRSIIAEALSLADAPAVEIESDMLGAARSLLGHQPGIAGILGTGSNSCCYDGSHITANIPPLGYILGDEGSGAAIGKRFVSDLYKGLLPPGIVSLWERTVGLSMADVIERVYRQPGANTFLASLTPFIKQASVHESVNRLILDEFDRYFCRNIDRYQRPGSPLGFIGSIALHFETQLTATARAHGYPKPAVCADPMPGLIDFHTSPKKIH